MMTHFKLCAFAAICALTLTACGGGGGGGGSTPRTSGDPTPGDSTSTNNLSGTVSANTVSYDGTTAVIDGVTQSGTPPYTNIELLDGNDQLTLSGNAHTSLTGYVDMGDDDDTVIVEAGTWVGYHSGTGGETTADGVVGNKCAATSSTATPGCIYGGADSDTIRLSAGVLFSGSFVNEDDAIIGNVVMTDDDNYFDSNVVPTDGMETPTDTYVNTGGGDDAIVISGGEWAGYDGGAAGTAAGTIYGGAGADTFTLSDEATITGNVIGDSEVDTITISSTGGTDRAVAGYVDGGSGDDTIEIGAGEWVGYHSGTGGETTADGVVGNKCAATSGTATPGCIYGGADSDTIRLSAGVLFSGSFVNEDDAIIGNVVMTDDDNYFDSNVVPNGYVDMGVGNDTVIVREGTWAGYHGGDGEDGTDCPTTKDAGCIYGGAGEDTFTLSGGTITNDILGDSEVDTIIIMSGSVGNDIRGGAGDDIITLSGGSIGNDIRGGSGEDTITISDGTVENLVRGGANDDIIDISGGTIRYVTGEADHDTITISEGDIGDIRGDTGNDIITLSKGRIGNDISGGPGNDEITISGGSVKRLVGGGNDVDTITISGGTHTINIEGGEGGDTINFRGGRISYALEGNAGDDTINFSGGRIRFDISGGTGDDTIIISGGTVGEGVFGGAYTDTAVSDSTTTDADRIIVSGGKMGYIDGGRGDDVVRILGAFGGDGTANAIEFTGDCVTDGQNTVWICGGDGTDRIEYAMGISAIAGSTDIATSCTFANAIHADRITEGFDADPSCSADLSPAPVSVSLGAFARGFEQAGVSPGLGLWGGLSSAMQSFGRAMMEDFTSNRARQVHIAESPQLTPYPSHVPAGQDCPAGTKHPARAGCAYSVIPSEVEESGNGRTAHLFTGQTHSYGPFHARQTHLRGESTTHLTLQGVPGATGTSSYSHDVNLIQHGFSTPVAAGLVAQGGFHLMQGSLTSSDGADEFMIEGYGAGTKLAYGGADIAMLGAWFDLSSDDWGRTMAFSGTQWIVSAGIEREMTLGAARLVPQARGFWQKTNIEEQGQISFSDEMIFTGKAGVAIEAGNHAFDMFFVRDDEASSLDAGLLQTHRMEEALEAGWRSYSVADGFSLQGELRYRHGLETGADSYSAGVAINRAF